MGTAKAGVSLDLSLPALRRGGGEDRPQTPEPGCGDRVLALRLLAV